MRVGTVVCAFLGLTLLAGACSSGGAPAQAPPSAPAEQETVGDHATDEAGEGTDAKATPSSDEPFTTGDLESLVLAHDQAPQEMEAGDPVLASAYGSGTVEENAETAAYGFVLYRTHVFSTPSSLRGAKLPEVGELGFYSLASSASVYEDAAGAAEHFDNPSPPADAQKDYERQPVDAELGENAVRISWREKSNFGGTVPFVRLSWLRGNARFALGGYGVKASDIDEDALLELAQEIDAAAVPTGAPPLELPEFTGTGKTLVKDSFGDRNSGWEVQEFSNASAGYEDGSWVMRLDEGGYTASAAGVDKAVADVSDVRVEFDGAVESDGGGLGALCRYGPKERYYVGAVDAAGAVNIGHVTGGKNSTYVALAAVEGAEVGTQEHHVQMDCVGDDVVRLQVQLDGEIVAEAFDLQGSLTTGAPGLYVEAGEKPVVGIFDNVRISQP